ncbi:hypothetical protein Acf1_00005 [Acidovorax phage ACF1]|nr:hypothetical protein Acf1_00005 [Acidovorax phage ACF1]
MTNIIKNGQVIRTSKNLRGMLDYARVSPVVGVESAPLKGQEICGTMRVLYQDGAECRANFKNYHIMIDFIRARRSWRGAKHVMQGDDMGYLTKPGIIVGN